VRQFKQLIHMFSAHGPSHPFIRGSKLEPMHQDQYPNGGTKDAVHKGTPIQPLGASQLEPMHQYPGWKKSACVRGLETAEPTLAHAGEL